MGQLLTANVATNLYWFGRYLERVESTLIEVIRIFDDIIDVDKKAGTNFYKNLDVNLKYKNSSDFLDKAIFGEHSANLYDAVNFARENAIICRSQINAEAFGEVIALHELFEHEAKSHTFIDYRFIDQALSLISEIWGCISQKQKREASDYFIRLGILVEKVDFHLRLGKDKEFALVVMEEIDTIVSILAPSAKFKNHAYSTKDTILDSVNNKINKIVAEEK